MAEESAAVTTETAPATTEVTTTEATPTPPTSEAAPAESTETQTAESAPSGEDSAEKSRKPGAEKRISELTRKRKEAEARAIAAEEQAAYFRQQVEGVEQPPFPKLEDFDYDQGQYQEAVASYMVQQNQRTVQDGIAQQHRMAAERESQLANQAAAEMFRERAQAFMEDTPDFAQVVGNPSFVQSDTMRQAIVFADNGPALAYHLASNPAIAQQINGLPPTMAAMQLGRIAARLATPPAPKTTETPAPTPPVGSSGVSETNPSKMSMEQYVAYRNKQREARNG